MFICPQCHSVYGQRSVPSTDGPALERGLIGYAHYDQMSYKQRQVVDKHAQQLQRASNSVRTACTEITLHDDYSHEPFHGARRLFAPRNHPNVHVYQMNDRAFCKLQKALHDGTMTHEFGGTLRVHGRDGTLVIEEQSNGGNNHVKIPVGTFMFHTHPNSCNQRRRCGLGMPSSQDVRRFHIDCVLHGCAAHFVFAKDGTYVVSVRPGVKDKLLRAHRQGSDAFDRLVEQYTEPFARMQEQFEAQRGHAERYPEFRKRWLEFCNNGDSSLQCLYFPQHEVPTIAIWN